MTTLPLLLSPFPIPSSVLLCTLLQGDTVATDEKDDEINAHKHTRVGWPSVSHDPIIHHGGPVFTCQDLGEKRE
jgi:hypothetical protein